MGFGSAVIGVVRSLDVCHIVTTFLCCILPFEREGFFSGISDAAPAESSVEFLVYISLVQRLFAVGDLIEDAVLSELLYSPNGRIIFLLATAHLRIVVLDVSDFVEERQSGGYARCLLPLAYAPLLQVGVSTGPIAVLASCAVAYVDAVFLYNLVLDVDVIHVCSSLFEAVEARVKLSWLKCSRIRGLSFGGILLPL